MKTAGIVSGDVAAPDSGRVLAPGGTAISWTQLMLALGVTVLGIAAFDVQLAQLWQNWTHDGLRSIGILALPASAWLAFRAWKWSDWQSGGSWWGALPLCVAVMLADSGGLLLPGFGGRAAINLIPIGFKLLLYMMGAVILFGGTAPLRRALFPLLLILLVNPFPLFVQSLLDLPLQTASARVARGFAGLLGVPLDGDVLHLMFTPGNGVFIAPGCDGLRGSVTLGFATLVAGHLYRLRPWVHAGYVLAAILAAYLLNFVRLCVVVIYTALAAHVSPSWFGHGEAFDYFEGGILFLLVAGLFLNWPRRHPQLCTPK